MTPRERVLTVFEHEEPDAVPKWLGASPELLQKAQDELALEDEEALRERIGDDFRRVFPIYVGPELPPLPEGVTSRTPFGIERIGMGYGQPTSHPLADATLAEIHAYPWPDPDWMDVSGIRAEAGRWGGRYAILGGEWAPFWHDAIDLLGMENLYLKMYDEPAVVDAVMQHVMCYYLQVSRRTFDAAADAIDIFFIGNDLGSQNGPLLSPTFFDRFLMPHISRLIDLGHAYGLKVMLHCCGGFKPLIPALIDAGLDGIHAVQPSCTGMDLATLKAEFGDRLVFNGCIDSHHVLIEGTPESVREATRQVLEIMMPGGGFVAGASHDYVLPETLVANLVTMFDAIREFGQYGGAPRA